MRNTNKHYCCQHTQNLAKFLLWGIFTVHVMYVNIDRMGRMMMQVRREKFSGKERTGEAEE